MNKQSQIELKLFAKQVPKKTLNIAIDKLSLEKKQNFIFSLFEVDDRVNMFPSFDPIINWEVILGVLDFVLTVYLLRNEWKRMKLKKAISQIDKTEENKILNALKKYLESVGEKFQNYEIASVNNLNGFIAANPSNCEFELIETTSQTRLVIKISDSGRIDITKRRNQ